MLGMHRIGDQTHGEQSLGESESNVESLDDFRDCGTVESLDDFRYGSGHVSRARLEFRADSEEKTTSTCYRNIDDDNAWARTLF